MTRTTTYYACHHTAAAPWFVRRACRFVALQPNPMGARLLMCDSSLAYSLVACGTAIPNSAWGAVARPHAHAHRRTAQTRSRRMVAWWCARRHAHHVHTAAFARGGVGCCDAPLGCVKRVESSAACCVHLLDRLTEPCRLLAHACVHVWLQCQGACVCACGVAGLLLGSLPALVHPGDRVHALGRWSLLVSAARCNGVAAQTGLPAPRCCAWHLRRPRMA
jgi:hypothetical protein